LKPNEPRVIVHKRNLMGEIRDGNEFTIILALGDEDEAKILKEHKWLLKDITRLSRATHLTLTFETSISGEG